MTIARHWKLLVFGFSAVVLTLAISGCDDDDDTTTGPPPGGQGVLRVITVTSGDTLDLDGFTITVDASDSRSAGPSDTLFFTGLSVGNHGVEATDIAVNCGIGTAANPRVLSVTADDTTTTFFTVSCSPALFDRIVFEQDRSDGTSDILTVRPDGSDPVDLTTEGDLGRPSVSPDGTRLAFMSLATAPDDTEILVMNVDGTGLDTLTDNTAADANPAWSPDGTRIVFDTDRDGNNEIYTMEVDGSNPTRVTDDPDDDFFPAWSPEDDLIAYTHRSNGFSSREVFVIGVDGTGAVNLTSNAEMDQLPGWSPNADRIVFEAVRGGETELFLMDPDGSNVVQLTSTDGVTERTARFSPDGNRIAFASDADGDFDIYVMDADGTNVQRVTDNAGDELFPVWTPGAASR